MKYVKARRSMRKCLAAFLAMILNLSALSAIYVNAFVVMDEEPTLVASALGDTFSVEYRFEGARYNRPGYAEGYVTVTPLEASDETHLYVLYWANEGGALEEYDPIASVTAQNGAAVFEMVRGMAIPEDAAGLYVVRTTQDGTADDAAVYVELPKEKLFESGDTEFRFASLSDIHLNYSYSSAKWLDVLNYMESIGVGQICTSGDFGNAASQSECRAYISKIEESDYTGKIWASLGNHDSGNIANFLKYLKDQGNDGENIYFSQIADNGDLFIFMAQDMLTDISNTPNQECFSKEQIDWLEGLLKQYAGTGVNIFIYEHASFRNWGAGDLKPSIYVQPINIRAEYPQTMRFKALLEEYREVILVTGHTHVAFSEMVNYDDNNGASARTVHNSSTSQVRRANKDKTALIYDTNEHDSEGYIVTVYEKDIVFRGMDFFSKRYIPTACYIMESYSDSHEDTKAVSKIEVDTERSTSVYYAGMHPDADDLTLRITYEDGTQSTVTEGFSVTAYGDYTVSPYETLQISDTSLLISYGGEWVFFPITVLPEEEAPSQTITDATEEGGAVVLSSALVNYGGSVTLQITPLDGYVYEGLLINGKNIGAESSYTISDIREALEVKALFTAEKTEQQNGEYTAAVVSFVALMLLFCGGIVLRRRKKKIQ